MLDSPRFVTRRSTCILSLVRLLFSQFGPLFQTCLPTISSLCYARWCCIESIVTLRMTLLCYLQYNIFPSLAYSSAFRLINITASTFWSSSKSFASAEARHFSKHIQFRTKEVTCLYLADLRAFGSLLFFSAEAVDSGHNFAQRAGLFTI